MTSSNIEASASAQLLDGDTVVVDRVAWERLNPDPTPDYTEGKFAYFGGEVESDGKRVWTGRKWESVAVAEQHALDILWAVAWARQEAQA
ncbi:hypothetical protein [Gordonia malaquae]|uniref:hypothetical protein n=1 Tax=Gordonia malaquae TaxID=410332 RepID=UPI003017908D